MELHGRPSLSITSQASPNTGFLIVRARKESIPSYKPLTVMQKSN